MAARQTPAQKAAAEAEIEVVDTSDSPDTPIGAEQPEQPEEAAAASEAGFLQALLTIHETLGFTNEGLETMDDETLIDVLVTDCGQVMRAQYDAALAAIPGHDPIDDGDVAWLPVHAYKVSPSLDMAWVYFEAMPHEGRTDIDIFNLRVPLATLRSRQV